MIRQFFYHLMMDKNKNIWVAPLKGILWICSIFYFMGVWLRLRFYRLGWLRSRRLPSGVISVGNITWGGTGKTPFVEYLAAQLTAENLKVAVLMRGYMSLTKGHSIDSFLGSDEEALLKENLKGVPILTGGNRFERAKEFLEKEQVDIFLLDDGFQHRRLKRDLDIVLLDTADPWGNGHLIPRGSLREPLSSLQRADIVLLTKSNLGRGNVDKIRKVLKEIKINAPILEAVYEPISLVDICNGQIHGLSLLADKKIFCFCSIGNPSSFEKMLKNLGAKLEKSFFFLDHHVYSKRDVAAINDYCIRHDLKYLVTTQKDAVKLAGLLGGLAEGVHIFYLKIHVQITEGAQILHDRIHSVIRR